MTDRNDVVAISGRDAASAQSRSIIGQISSKDLRIGWKRKVLTIEREVVSKGFVEAGILVLYVACFLKARGSAIARIMITTKMILLASRNIRRLRPRYLL